MPFPRRRPVTPAASPITAALGARARATPAAVALRLPGSDGQYRAAIDASALDQDSDAFAVALASTGLAVADRLIVMLPPTRDFFVAMFGAFKAGIVPVLIDPGIDRKALKRCLAEVDAQGFLGVPLALIGRKLLGWAPSARITIAAGRPMGRLLARFHLDRLIAGQRGQPLAAHSPVPDDTAAILFTSGATGVPKGVVYRHRHFSAQLEMLRDSLSIEAGAVDLATFPPFALFDPALGLTSVIADMDPRRPGHADPKRLLAALERFECSQLFGSPALIDVLVRHGSPLPTLRRVSCAGAPVPAATVAAFTALLNPDARFFTPYGATECLPVAVIEAAELATTRTATQAGDGTCVGRPVRPNQVRIIAVNDEPIAHWDDAFVLAAGEIGEITVAGPSVTDSYFGRPEATHSAKIAEEREGETVVVHRMGDAGWLDGEGRLWFVGRLRDRVTTVRGPWFTECIEAVARTVPGIFRAALVGLGAPGQQLPVLMLQANRDGRLPAQTDRVTLEGQVRESLRLAPLRFLPPGADALLVDLRVRFMPRLPVDIRHNAKIRRDLLAQRLALGR